MSDVVALGLIQSYLAAMARGATVTLEETSAWHEFHRAHDPKIRAIVRRGATAVVDADDLTQDVWLLLSRQLLKLTLDPSRGTLDAWVATVAQRYSHRLARSRSSRRVDVLTPELATSLLDPRDAPSAECERKESCERQRAVLAKARAGLTEFSRQVLDLR